MKTVPATKAFILCKEKVLIVREATGYAMKANIGQYDVVGGRLQPGQSFTDSLRREVREEVGLEITVGQPFFVIEWQTTIANEATHIIATYFICQATTDNVTLSNDHDDYQWIDPRDYASYPIIATLAPAFEQYLKMTGVSRTSNKLVRDKVPAEISADNRRPFTHWADDDEYRAALVAKLQEEAHEFASDQSVEELADVVEVVAALQTLPGYKPSAVQAARDEKNTRRGAFAERIILDKIEK